MYDQRVHGIVWYEEGVPLAGIDVAHRYIEAAVLEVHVGIDSDDGVAAYLGSLVACVLYGELLDGRAVVGSIVGREEAHVAAYLHAQNLGNAYSEEQVEVGVDVELRQWQGILIAAGLKAHLVVPVDDFPVEVLGKRSPEHLHRACLHDIDGVTVVGGQDASFLSVLVQGVLHPEVGVVRHILKPNLQPCPQLVQSQCAVDLESYLAVQVVVVPPCGLRMVVPEEEGRLAVHEAHMEVGQEGVASEAQLQVRLAVDVEVADVFADKPYLARGIEVEARTLCPGQLTAHRHIVLVVRYSAALLVHELIGTQLVCAEERDAHRCPFVEAFAKGKAEGVAHRKGTADVFHVHPVSVIVIGVVVPNLVTHYYAAVLDGIEDEARREGYSVLSANSHERYEDEEHAIDNFISMHVEGIIACLAQSTTDYHHFEEISEMVKSERINLVHLMQRSKVK